MPCWPILIGSWGEESRLRGILSIIVAMYRDPLAGRLRVHESLVGRYVTFRANGMGVFEQHVKC